VLRQTRKPGEGFIVSLNRYEQALFDYWRHHPDEERHWRAKVAGQSGGSAAALTEELCAYVKERGTQVEPFREWEKQGGVPRSSLLNLAEYLLRVWRPVVVRKNAVRDDRGIATPD
jgi:hypothetical protein